MANIAIHKEQRIGGKSTGTRNHDQLKAVSRANHAAGNWLSLQQTWGNQAVQQIVSSCPAFSACPTGGACHACPYRVQTKPTVGRPKDEWEQEADRTAEAVMKMLKTQAPERVSVSEGAVRPTVQRACTACGEALDEFELEEEEQEKEEETIKPKNRDGLAPADSDDLLKNLSARTVGQSPIGRSADSVTEHATGADGDLAALDAAEPTSGEVETSRPGGLIS